MTRPASSSRRRPGAALRAAPVRAAALLLLLCGVALLLAGSPEAERPPQPNFVLIMTDDQTVADMAYMQDAKAELEARGASFTNAITPFPLCCPSRASYMTGQYAHNHGLWTNSAADGGGLAGFKDKHSFARYLNRAGYRTGFFGKYLNGLGHDKYGPRNRVPRGWDRFVGKAGGTYYGYTLLIDGKERRFGNSERRCERRHPASDYASGSEWERDVEHCLAAPVGPYMTDQLTRMSERFLERSARADKPYFLWLSHWAPHTEGAPRKNGLADPRPAKRHRGAFAGMTLDPEAARSPAFNARNVAGKPFFVRERERLRPKLIAELRRQNRARRASLLAVDESVRRILGVLDRAGQMDETYVFYVSDNGFLFGEHRMRGKPDLYEEALRVPFYMLGPDVPAGARIDEPVANIDFAATVYALAGVKPEHALDGRSLTDAFDRPSPFADRYILLENLKSNSAGGRESYGVRGTRYKYIQHENLETGALEEELYDLREDPRELRSAHRDPGYAPQKKLLRRKLNELRACAGRDCR